MRARLLVWLCAAALGATACSSASCRPHPCDPQAGGVIVGVCGPIPAPTATPRPAGRP